MVEADVIPERSEGFVPRDVGKSELGQVVPLRIHRIDHGDLLHPCIVLRDA